VVALAQVPLLVVEAAVALRQAEELQRQVVAASVVEEEVLSAPALELSEERLPLEKMEASVTRFQALVIASICAGTMVPAYAGNLYLACADALPEKRKLFLQAAVQSPVDHGSASESADAVKCRLLVPSARGLITPMRPTAGKDSFMKSDNIERAMQRSYPK
jgi:hypothetical protein